MFEDHRGLKITMVIVKLEREPKNDSIKGYAQIDLNGCLTIHGIKIVENGKGRLLLVMPDRRREDWSFASVVYPTDSQTRRYFEHVVLAEYERELHKEWDRVRSLQLQAAG